jgi:hypothetical protein
MKLWWLDAIDDGPDALGPGDAPAPSRVDVVAATSSAVSSSSASTTTSSSGPDVTARALIAMACADGAPCAAERAFVVDVVGVDAAAAHTWRVYRPREAGPAAGPLGARRVLHQMAQVALCDRDDGVLDDSEKTLLLSYARAYDVALDEVERLLVHAGARARGEGLARVFARLSADLSTRLSTRLSTGLRAVLRRRSSSSSPSSSSSLSSGSVVVRPWEVR